MGFRYIFPEIINLIIERNPNLLSEEEINRLQTRKHIPVNKLETILANLPELSKEDVYVLRNNVVLELASIELIRQRMPSYSLNFYDLEHGGGLEWEAVEKIIQIVPELSKAEQAILLSRSYIAGKGSRLIHPIIDLKKLLRPQMEETKRKRDAFVQQLLDDDEGFRAFGIKWLRILAQDDPYMPEFYQLWLRNLENNANG